jgi:hypothetical protein
MTDTPDILTGLVRPLVWRERSRGIWISGDYSVWHEWLGSGMYFAGVKPKGSREARIGDGFKSLEAAQAAANADHVAKAAQIVDADKLRALVGAALDARADIAGAMISLGLPASMSESVKRIDAALATLTAIKGE